MNLELCGRTIVVDGLQSSPRCRHVLLLRFRILITVFFSWFLLLSRAYRSFYRPIFLTLRLSLLLRLGFSFLFLGHRFVYTWLEYFHLKRAMDSCKFFLLLRSSCFQSNGRAKSRTSRSRYRECFSADSQKSTLTPSWDSFRWFGGD